MTIHHRTEDTICALATPAGIGSIAVIRLSGPQAIDIAAKRFENPETLLTSDSQRAHVGYFVDDKGSKVDEVVVTPFLSPKSYTGEDIVEISLHGGMLVAERIIEALLKSGARIAEPGEFTKRAFLNGKLDLAQAEAVADIIHATSDEGLRISLSQLNGELSEKIRDLRDSTIQTLAMLELELDFVEDGYVFTEKKQIKELVEGAIENIEFLLSTYGQGKTYREGIRVALIGAPNVGKSSIMNLLLGRKRAIVTEIPGTTRDTLEEGVQIGGILYRFIDTAGIRTTEDIVEREGVRRSREEVELADIIALIFDGERGLGEVDKTIVEETKGLLKNENVATLGIINKIDISNTKKINSILEFESNLVHETIQISAKTGEGFKSLLKTLENSVKKRMIRKSEGGFFITNLRHFSALQRAKKSLIEAEKSIKTNQSGEFITVDLRVALAALGEIIGETTTDDILNSIFGKFCIGK